MDIKFQNMCWTCLLEHKCVKIERVHGLQKVLVVFGMFLLYMLMLNYQCYHWINTNIIRKPKESFSSLNELSLMTDIEFIIMKTY